MYQKAYPPWRINRFSCYSGTVVLSLLQKYRENMAVSIGVISIAALVDRTSSLEDPQGRYLLINL